MPVHINQPDHIRSSKKSDYPGSQLYSETDRIFYHDGYHLAKEYLGKYFTYEKMLMMSSVLYNAVDRLIKSFKRRCRIEGKTVDCRKRCFICCHQTVLILPYEAFYIASFIQKNLDKNDPHQILKRIIQKDNITRNMNIQDLLAYKDPCPLLKNGTCMVYEARPMACRTYLSSSLAGCKNEYDHPKDFNVFPGLYEFTLRAGRMMNEGISAFFTENYIFPTEYQIESSLLTALKEENAFERWLNGENIFQKRNYTDDEIVYLNRFGLKNDVTD